jgi:Holliday junction DNA helicase RuvA
LIGRLHGRLVRKRPTGMTVDVGGVGFELLVPLSTYESLPAAGEEVSVVTHLHVREDVLQLYGFATDADRELFRLLIAVSGVGPKLALAVLSGLRATEFRDVVAAGDVARLRLVPGIGKRTAERLVVELKDRLGLTDAPVRKAEVAALGLPPEVYDDAVATLTTLGYTSHVAQRAVREAVDGLGAQAALEQLVREALRRLTR